MKKILPLLAALVLVFTLAACGENDTSDKPLNSRPDNNSETQQGGAQGIKDGMGLSLEAILMYAETGDTEYFQPRVLTAAEQAELRADVEQQGGSVSFDGDGTIHITGSGSSRLTVRPDGSVEGVDDGGQPFGYSKNTDWPTSAFGSAVPKADFEIKMLVEDDEGLMIMFGNVTFEQAKAYGKKLADAGFTVDPSEIEMKDNGMYGYSGRNSSDLSVEFNYLDSNGSISCALTVEKYSDEIPGYDPYTSTDEQGQLPPEFAFLLPDGNGDYSVIDYGYYKSIQKENASVSEAKSFAALCQSNGFTEYSSDEGQNADGSSSYAGIYTKGDLQIFISYNVIEVNKLFVNVSVAEEVSEPEPVAGTDPWPSSGALTRIPKPDFGTGFTIRDDGDKISVWVSGATAANFAPYMQSLKDAGFTLSPEYDDDDDVKYYEAYNKDGYDAYVQWVEGVFAVGVTTIPE